MKTQHTPGPWRVDMDIIDTATDIRSPDGWIVCQMSGKRTELRDANARLIAAAPELLSALQECMAWHNLDAHRSHPVFAKESEIGRRMLDAARSVIAKATGEKP